MRDRYGPYSSPEQAKEGEVKVNFLQLEFFRRKCGLERLSVPPLALTTGSQCASDSWKEAVGEGGVSQGGAM